MAGIPQAWIDAPYALVHGEDGDARRAAVAAWKARHVDPEWADFSLTVCSEGCPWAEVQNALCECAPFGALRVVVVPQAENLLEKAKELPPSIRQLLLNPFEDTRLLLVARAALSAGPGRILGSKPFSDWVKEGRVFKTGALDPKEVPAFLEAEARSLGLKLERGVVERLALRLGGNPGILRRTLEVLELLAEGRSVGLELADAATFRLGEQGAFTWSQAWQKGQTATALLSLRQAMEDEPSGAALMLLGQARREVERLARLQDARQQGLSTVQELCGALGLGPRQDFLLGGYQRVLDRIGPEGVGRLLRAMTEADLDLKGLALSRSSSPLVDLTLTLCRAWA